MADDLLRGHVTSFRREQGFGVITLDDGREVKFDASICKMVPEEGTAVQLRVGPARWGGGLKALHVEPGGSPALFAAAAPLTLDQQIATLQREHLVSALSEHVMAQLVDEAFDGQLGDATLIDVIDAFYVQDGARARHDGYLRRVQPFRYDAADILAEIAALLPNARIPRQLAKTRAAPSSSEQTLGIESLPVVVDLVNDSLRAAGDARRLYPLATGGDWRAYLALPADRAQRLTSVLPFATPPQEIG
jgi:cold shock CspA family protein